MVCRLPRVAALSLLLLLGGLCVQTHAAGALLDMSEDAFPATPLVYGEQHLLLQRRRGADYDPVREYLTSLVQVSDVDVHGTSAPRVVAPARAVPVRVRDEVSNFTDDITDLETSNLTRECPPAQCPANASCPHDNGICCSKGSHCCPYGSICTKTDPPVCVFDKKDDPRRCMLEPCNVGFHCPIANVSVCCLGGELCCREGLVCHESKNGTICAKPKTPADFEQQRERKIQRGDERDLNEEAVKARAENKVKHEQMHKKAASDRLELQKKREAEQRSKEEHSKYLKKKYDEKMAESKAKQRAEEAEKSKLQEAKAKAEKLKEEKRKVEDGIAWKFNDAKGATKALSVNKDATLTLTLGAKATLIGGALKVLRNNTKGEGCATNTPNSKLLHVGKNSFTMFARVLTVDGGKYQRIISRKKAGSSSWFSLMVHERRPVFEVSDSLRVQGFTNIANGKWHTVAVVRDVQKKELRLYVNGEVERKSKEATAANLDSDVPIQIGCLGDEIDEQVGTNFFGMLRDVQIVRRAMNDDEVSDHASDENAQIAGAQLQAVHDEDVAKAEAAKHAEQETKKKAEEQVKAAEAKTKKEGEETVKAEQETKRKAEEAAHKKRVKEADEKHKAAEAKHKKQLEDSEEAFKAKAKLEQDTKSAAREKEEQTKSRERIAKAKAEAGHKSAAVQESVSKKAAEQKSKNEAASEKSAKTIKEEQNKFLRAKAEALQKQKHATSERTEKARVHAEEAAKQEANERDVRKAIEEQSEKKVQESKHKDKKSQESADKKMAEEKNKVSLAAEKGRKKVKEQQQKLTRAKEDDAKEDEERKQRSKNALETANKASKEELQKRELLAARKREAQGKTAKEGLNKQNRAKQEKKAEQDEKREQAIKRSKEQAQKTEIEKQRKVEDAAKDAQRKKQADQLKETNAKELGFKAQQEQAHKKTMEAKKKEESVRAAKAEQGGKHREEQEDKARERREAALAKQQQEAAFKKAKTQQEKARLEADSKSEAAFKKKNEARDKAKEEASQKRADKVERANETKKKALEEQRQKEEKKIAHREEQASKRSKEVETKAAGEELGKRKAQAAEAAAKRAQAVAATKENELKRAAESGRKKHSEQASKKDVAEQKTKESKIKTAAAAAKQKSQELSVKEKQGHEQRVKRDEKHVKAIKEATIKSKNNAAKTQEVARKREQETQQKRVEEQGEKKLKEQRLKAETTQKRDEEQSTKKLKEGASKRATEQADKRRQRLIAEQRTKAEARQKAEAAAKANVARERAHKANVKEQKAKSQNQVFMGGMLKPRRGYVLRHNQHVQKSHTYSYAFWYKPVGVYHAWTNVLHKGGHDRHRSPSVYQYPGSTRLHLRLSSSGGWNTGADPGHHLPLFRWTHVAFTVTKGRFRVYYNGHMVHNGGYHFPHVNSGPLFTSNPWYVSARVYLADLRYAAGELSHGTIRTLFGQRRYKDFTAHFVWITSGTIRPRKGWIIRHVNHMPHDVGAFTLTLWVRPIHNIGSWGSLYHQGNTNTARLGGTLWFYPGSSRLHMRSSTYKHWNDGLDPGQHLPHHRWTHVAIRHWWGMMEVYYNGHRVAAAGRAGPIGHRGHVYTGDPWHHTGVAYLADIRYYWDGLLSHAQIRGIMNQRRHANIPTFAWRTIYSRVCFHARGGYGTFYISGAHQIKAFRLRYLSGWVSCAGVGRHAHLRSHWGCDGRSTSLSVIITDNHGNGREVSPRGGVRGYSRHHHSWFKLSGATANSPTLTFWQTNGLAYQTGNGRHAMRLYYLESLKRYTLGDNAGATCARVEGYMT